MGTNFVNPISRGRPPMFHESSGQRIGNDSDSAQKAWKKNARTTDQSFRLSQSVEQIQRELNRLRLRRSGFVSSAAATPFKIKRGRAADPVDNWLAFRVSEGYLITTDHAIVPTYSGDDHVFELTTGVAKYYFSLVITSGPTDIPTTAIISTSSTLPVWGVDVIPIGWVDTDTYAAETPPRSVIHQFLRVNVFSPCIV